jgi:hypothetical protein
MNLHTREGNNEACNLAFCTFGTSPQAKHSRDIEIDAYSKEPQAWNQCVLHATSKTIHFSAGEAATANRKPLALQVKGNMPDNCSCGNLQIVCMS